MTWGRKTDGRNFEKGVSPNPEGFKGMPKELRAARKITQFDFLTSVNLLVKMDRAQLQEVMNNPATNTLDLMLGGIIIRAITEQCHHRAEFILNRLIGRVAIQADIQFTEGKETPVVNFGVTKDTIDVISENATIINGVLL